MKQLVRPDSTQTNGNCVCTEYTGEFQSTYEAVALLVGRALWYMLDSDGASTILEAVQRASESRAVRASAVALLRQQRRVQTLKSRGNASYGKHRYTEVQRVALLCGTCARESVGDSPRSWWYVCVSCLYRPTQRMLPRSKSVTAHLLGLASSARTSCGSPCCMPTEPPASCSSNSMAKYEPKRCTPPTVVHRSPRVHTQTDMHRHTRSATLLSS